MPRKFEYFDKNKRPEIKPIEWQKDYVDYEYKTVKKSTGPGEDDFELEETVIEHRTNIEEFVNSYGEDVGVEAVLKRVALTGDTSLLEKIPEMHADLTQIPENPEERFNMMTNNLADVYSKLDPELTKGLSIEDFIKNLTPEMLEEYINKKVHAKVNNGGKPDENN